MTTPSPYPVGTVVTWTDAHTGGRRFGTVASVRQSRRGPVYRLHEGDGSTGEHATYSATRNARGVLDFPGAVLTPYVRRWWPNPDPGAPFLDHDPATTCDECGSPEPGGGCDADCPTRDEQAPGVCDDCEQPTWPGESHECDQPEPEAPDPTLGGRLVFIHVSDLDGPTGGGAGEAVTLL